MWSLYLAIGAGSVPVLFLINDELEDYDTRVIHSLITSAVLNSFNTSAMNLGPLPLAQSLTYNEEFGPSIDDRDGAVEQITGHSRYRIRLVHITPQAVAAAAIAVESQQYAALRKFQPAHPTELDDDDAMPDDDIGLMYALNATAIRRHLATAVEEKYSSHGLRGLC